MAQWANQVIVINNKCSIAINNHQNKFNIPEGAPIDILTQPLVNGGQGKSGGNGNQTLLHQEEDINHGLSQGSKCHHLPHERDPPACPAVKSTQTQLTCGGSTDSTVPPTPKRAVAMPSGQGIEFEGLEPPTLTATGTLVSGKDIEKLRLQNKQTRRALQEQQRNDMMWSTHTGATRLPTPTSLPEAWRGAMCPSGIAMSHPAGKLLSEWAQMGCPTRTGWQLTKAEIWEAVERGPHCSALSTEALQHFTDEVKEKVTAGQCKTVEWDSIKDNPSPQLKISPIAAIPH
jgi:hypothetical protein